MSTKANTDLVRQAFDYFNKGDLGLCAEQFLAYDFIANLPGSPDPRHGRDAWKETAMRFRQAFPDIHASIEDIFAANDRVVVRLSFRGTHRGTFEGIPATDRSVAYTSIETYRVADNRIAEEWVSPDIATLFRQISPPQELRC